MGENSSIHYDADGGFVQLARQFCNFVENSASFESRDFLETSQLFLIKIYQLVGDIEVTDNGAELPFDHILNNAQFDEIVELIKNKLLDHRYYWVVFDPINVEDTEPGCGDLLDDISDIYKDVKGALLLYDSGLEDAKDLAMWQVKFDFENHWGQHCINAIYAFHYFLRK